MKSHLKRSAFKPQGLFPYEEIEEVFANSDMFEKSSFNVIGKDGEYDYHEQLITMASEASRIRRAFKSGSSIRVENMEDWNMSIATRANELKYGTNVHMYLAPPVKDATGFNWHTDDRDVYIHMIYGQKIFEVKEHGDTATYKLMPGDLLFLPKEFEHRATPVGPSCQLSFGLPQGGSYYIPEGIVNTDLL
jgi:hypothetical protein